MTTQVEPLVCEACGSTAKQLRHSDHWDFDVARCRSCGTGFVPGLVPSVAAPVVEEPAGEPKDIDWEGYVAVTRDDHKLRVQVLDRLKKALPGARPKLFDVGAGSGHFLVMAQEAGFEAAGNDVSLSAVAYVDKTHGIKLSSELLDAQPASSVDAITMWCVVAHVDDAREFLSEAFAMLRPGGVLFLRTPRWCALDTTGIRLAKVSRGRWHGLIDRRVTRGHLRLYSAEGLSTLLEEVGFAEVEATAAVHYGSTTDFLLPKQGPMRMVKPATRLIDAMIERSWAPRNALMVYARRPDAV
jgi:SAM-dependent methyltransferase